MNPAAPYVLPLLLVLLALLGAPARAHLMVAQKGTLNFHGDGAYLVVSLPVSALQGADADGDGLLASNELQAQAAAVEQQIRAGVQLQAEGRALPLEVLLMTLSPPDDAPSAPASQLVVLGRFALGALAGSAGPAAATVPTRYVFKLALFGKTTAEQAHDITFTRQREMHAARFSPGAVTQALFPSAAGVFATHLRSGLHHVATGLDHLLFLGVVLVEWALARRGWRQAVLTFTVFTVGHAITLAWSAFGGWAPPAQIVEPAIVATIVAMAALVLWQHRRGRWIAHPLQLLLVLGCALIHGLGFASALGGLGLDGAHRAWALAGFNAGIELAQLLAAAMAAALGAAWGLARQHRALTTRP